MAVIRNLATANERKGLRLHLLALDNAISSKTQLASAKMKTI
ncbi:Uncharacterized protein APZ42_006762 [Daphnia magna]|uniref:Uncharacterized protein n=1 Tax=Daphnia magna TaxID=35525 RepID=A0A164FQ02_9CRUS|nr:Uncharacterized protein APZ42_006762 [Daphnia magna]